MRMNLQGYLTMGKGQIKQNVFVVKEKLNGEGYISPGQLLIFPPSLVGKRVRIKVEPLADNEI